MVTLTGLASSTPLDAAHAAVSAFDRSRQPAVPTRAQSDALAALDAVQEEIRQAPQKAAAAKVDYLRSKLTAIKLAAGTAAAAGDIEAAGATMRDVRTLTKELSQALQDAGLGDKGANLPGQGADVPAAAKSKGKPGTDRDQAREGGKEIVQEFRKIVDKLRLAVVAARIRGASPEEIKEVERALRDGEKELQSVAGSLSAPPSGPLVDLDA